MNTIHTPPSLSSAEPPAGPFPGPTAARRGRDPRLYQIAVLGTLLVYGVVALDFAIGPAQIAAVLGAALLTQAVASRWVGLARIDPRSALISGLSICLLLRAGAFWVPIAAAAIAVASKFALRIHGKHVFNPANFGIVVSIAGLALLGRFDLVRVGAWISPGQWGSAALWGFTLVSLGALVVRRAERSDVTWTFLGVYAGGLFVRALWLGDPLTLPLHRLSNGAFLLFAFFMISDPKTSPDRRLGRIAWAAAVAGLGLAIELGLYRSAGPIWALIVLAPLVPLIDLAFRRLERRGTPTSSPSSPASTPSQGDSPCTDSPAFAA